MEFIYSLINMLAEMAPYLLFGFLVAGILYAFVPGNFIATTSPVREPGR